MYTMTQIIRLHSIKQSVSLNNKSVQIESLLVVAEINYEKVNVGPFFI